ncbi:hypothetical protein BT96DRAFT_810625 [Gymnopus androsaceus JB14]|uniref:Yeast cell wall synthesis Kre9/Knh1-like N-terminal domain-containing protein n=1 Tax=Gymnopus androsaceus JB14 TaxID=1447944 RepID=A0A6A4ICN8_9AGAR|nr:hypothetical protein BT96DRAFT_810625 [Gymnopus androsaceus JB14]
MYSLKALALALVVALDAFSAVQATLYVSLDPIFFANLLRDIQVIQPSSGSTCSGGQPCTVQWLDDGTNPLNSDIGVTTCGLYTGDMQLVQSIPAVNVANTQSLTFTPIPDAGPDSSDYYIAFTSQNLTVNGTNFTGYSSFFSLNNMSGSFSSPLASATSTIPIPSTLTDSSASTETGVLVTITVGSVDTSLLP